MERHTQLSSHPDSSLMFQRRIASARPTSGARFEAWLAVWQVAAVPSELQGSPPTPSATLGACYLHAPLLSAHGQEGAGRHAIAGGDDDEDVKERRGWRHLVFGFC